MLTRVADAMFWTNAYIERAENLARFIHVNINSWLEKYVESQGIHWNTLLAATGDEDLFIQKYSVVNNENVLKFLLFDRDYPNSIFSSIYFARENAKGIRDSISSEMWLQLNNFYYQMKDYSKKRKITNYHELLTDIKTGSNLFNALADTTMSHGDGWHFLQLGRMLERADKTTRILDVKCHLLTENIYETLNPASHLEWVALLQSTGALDMYRKKHQKIKPKNIISFLLLDERFPRSLNFCIAQSSVAIQHLCEKNKHHKILLDNTEVLQSNISQISKIENQDSLHECVDDIQKGINEIISSLNNTFFK